MEMCKRVENEKGVKAARGAKNKRIWVTTEVVSSIIISVFESA